MKKMLVLALALVFILSGAVMAQPSYPGTLTNPLVFDESDIWSEYYANYDDHFNDDGVVVYNHVDPNNPGMYTILEDMDRTGYTLDTDGRNQVVEILVDVEAYIPCFIEMKLTGNQGTTAAISYGANAEASTEADGYHIVFDNEIGGFLNEDWVSLGHGQNAEINPGSEVYIGACDMFMVEVISNDQFKYSVKADPLSNTAGNLLPMDMRTQVNGAAWTEDTFATVGDPEVVKFNGTPGNKMEALHNFRVPYNMGVTHGRYDGEILFRAVTI
jgi:hypothetical protein